MKSQFLKDLKKTLQAEAPVLPVRQMPVSAPKPAQPELSDEELFAQATRGVKRMEVEALPAPKPVPKKLDAQALIRRAAAEGHGDGPVEGLSDTSALLNPVGTEAFLEFARSGVQARVMKQLKQGKPAWQAAVDLHGCTLDDAREAVSQLVFEAKREGVQTIKIVHGKGTQSGHPLLKTCVNSWLKQLSDVLAFVSAQARDGGTGAVYVLLKRNRELQPTHD